MAEELTYGEKEFLLKIARATLEKYLAKSEKLEPQSTNAKLWQQAGVFVTLTKKGKLRGCIGYLEPVESMLLAVRDNAISASRDPRFLPLEFNELKDIKIGISVLTEPVKTTLAEIKTGDGVIIKSGYQQATYLPQVWQELPDRDDFFSSLCQKAGLPPDSYLNGEVEFYKYQAMVFGE